MSLIWSLQRELYTRKNLFRPVDLQALLIEQGLKLSRPAVGSLVNETPDAVRLRTMQAICNALGCRLSDFCIMEPDATNHTARPNSGDSLHFPDPFQFPIHEID